MKEIIIYILFGICAIGLLVYLYFVIKNPKRDYEKDIPILKDLYEDVDLDEETEKNKKENEIKEKEEIKEETEEKEEDK